MIKIPLSEPSFSGKEWQYLKDCLDSGWVSTSGGYVQQFQDKICELTGAKFAVAVMNGTIALDLALRLLDIGPGDEVIVPTLTFIAPVNCVYHTGAEPVFMDCDDYYNIDAEKVIKFLIEETVMLKGESETSEDNVCINRTTGNRIAAIIPVHVFGNACDLEKLLPECKRRNIMIIEDAAESMGTRYIKGTLQGKYTGTVGDMGCYSFNGNKIITCGGGGMLVTDNEELAKRAMYLSSQAKDDPVKYVHNEAGYNYRMTNLQAALGCAQLEQLPEFLRIKKQNYEYYNKKFESNADFGLAAVPDYAEQNYWLYTLRSRTRAFTAFELIERLKVEGVESRPVWKLNHEQKMYADNTAYHIERARELYSGTINIPSSSSLTKEEMDKVISSITAGRVKQEKKENKQNKQVLLIGGNGFIGRYLAEKLDDLGYKVFIADRKNVPESKFDYIFTDITMPVRISGNYEYVFHLAGISNDGSDDPMHYESINTQGTINVLEWLKENKVRKFIFLSSSSIYGRKFCKPVDELNIPNPETAYAVSKLSAEKWVKLYCTRYKIPGLIFRLFNVYGAGMSDFTSFGEIKKQLESSSSKICMRNVHDIIDIVHIKDVIHAIIQSLNKDISEVEILNVCNNRGISILELIKTSMKILNISKEVISEKSELENYRVGNSAKIKRFLNWKADVDLETGLRDYLIETNIEI